MPANQSEADSIDALTSSRPGSSESAPREALEDALQSAIEYFTSNLEILAWLLVAIIAAPLIPKKEVRRAAFWSIVAFGALPGGMSVLVIVAILVAFSLKFGIQSVPEGSVGIVLRLGKFSRVLRPGLNFIVPGVDRVHAPEGLSVHQGDRVHPLHDTDGYISTKEQILNPDPLNCIGSDNSVVEVDSVVYFTIVDARKVVFKVDNLGASLLTLAETTLRQEVGRLDADEVISSRDILGAKLQEALSVASEPWGTRINRVEIESITFDEELQKALSEARQRELEGRAKVIAAERERDAQIARAEGQKKAQELEAEAAFTREKLEAEAEYLRESRRREGEAAGLMAIAESLKAAPEAMIALEALKAQTQVAEGLGQSDGLLLVPNETAGLVGALGSAIKAWDRFKQNPAD